MIDKQHRPKRQGITYPKPNCKEWRRLLKRVVQVHTGFDSPCWIWTGRVDPDGYGEAKYRGAKRFTHRISYARKHGETPARRDVEHLCRQRACLNPSHIISLPPKENAAGRSERDEAPHQVNKHNVFEYVSQEIIPI